MGVDVDRLILELGGRRVLDGVSLHARPGEIYGLLGPNGAGKSTTLSVVTGLRVAGSGHVTVLGRDPAREATALHGEIGVLPEHSGFYGWMDARAYLAWFGRLYGIRLAPRQIAMQLAEVGLDGKDRRPIATYSRGMRQRLGLARALLHRPRLLILDEPTNGLDPRGRRELHDLLVERSRQEGVGILICTHLLDDVERLCTRIGIIHQGRTVLEGLMSELIAADNAAGSYRLHLQADPPAATLPLGVNELRWQGEWARVELNGLQAPEDIWRGMLDAHWAIDEIRRDSSRLEDLYLRHTGTEASA
jgi:ABC-2 type transport system ATP-binding protein